LVEGLEDLAYLSAYVTLTDRTEEFRRLGCHIVQTHGKGSMIQPLAIAKLLEIPTFVIFDADGHDTRDPGHRAQHERENLALLRLCSVANPSAFPTAIFQTECLLMWPTEIGEVIQTELGKEEWEGFEAAVRAKRKIADVPRLGKNMLFIGQVLTEAFRNGKKSRILDRLCAQIISFARAAKAGPSTPLQSAAPEQS